jgi:hypothetical protein
MTEDIAPARRALRQSIKDKLGQMPGGADANGWSDLDRQINESAARNRNDGWTQAEIVDANAAASTSPTGMRPNPAQGGSAGGVTPEFSDTHEGRMKRETAKMNFDEGGGPK